MNTPNRNFGLFRALSLIGLVAGGIGAEAMMLYVGRRNPSWILRVLFTGWVLAPFIGLVLAQAFSKDWSAVMRTTLYALTLCLSAASLAIYARVAFGPPMPQPAFAFLAVPLASWLIAAITLWIAARIGARRSA